MLAAVLEADTPHAVRLMRGARCPCSISCSAIPSTSSVSSALPSRFCFKGLGADYISVSRDLQLGLSNAGVRCVAALVQCIEEMEGIA